MPFASTEPSSDLRYPIGPFHYDGPATPEQRRQWIRAIETTPARLRAAVERLSEDHLDTPYRPGGWTVRQVVHHLADSHLNSYVRFRLALTEDTPTIKPYDEKLWANLPDARGADLECSLQLLESLHRRWVMLLRAMKEEDWARTFRHPDLGLVTLERNLALYAWHGAHHIAHIVSMGERE